MPSSYTTVYGMRIVYYKNNKTIQMTCLRLSISLMSHYCPNIASSQQEENRKVICCTVIAVCLKPHSSTHSKMAALSKKAHNIT